jgi:predicted protein tyrosine phosphatase
VILSPDRVSFDRVTDLVYIGSKITSVDDYHRLRAEGVRACVDMKQESADPWTWEAFLWLPTLDHDPPSQLHLRMGIGFLRQCERDKVPAVVHCMAGVGRSTTLVLAYLLAGQQRGQPTSEVLRFLRARRAVVNPTAAQVAAAEEAARTFEV